MLRLKNEYQVRQRALAKVLGFTPEYVMMDSWYIARVLLQQVRGYARHFVTRMFSNPHVFLRKIQLTLNL